MMVYATQIIMEYNVMLPIKMNEDQLTDLTKKLTRPKWLMPRNFGLRTHEGKYFKLQLPRVLAIEATEMGEVDPEGDFIAKRG